MPRGQRNPRTDEDIEKEFNLQLELLEQLCKNYDEGYEVVGKSIASSIRVLLHETSASSSLIGQVGRINQPILDTASLREEMGGIWAGSYSGLTGVAVGGPRTTYLPMYDSNQTPRFLNYDEYWNENIIKDQQNNDFSRKDVVLSIANTDGGSHVDAGLEPKYQQLSRENSLGWIKGDDTNWLPMNGAEHAVIRQIAHEILKTFKSDYVYARNYGEEQAVIGGVGFVLHTTPQETPRRQGPCPCGSGKKYKRCHGK